ncbi:MAG: DUF1043 family protein [Woeseiaceae bacterium]
MSPFIVVLVGLVCLGLGIGLGLWFASMKQSIAAGKADDVQRAFDDYKSDVNSHFADTAKHFSAIGHEYRALYNHMASGAESLLGAESDLGQDAFPTLIAERTAADANGPESVTATEENTSADAAPEAEDIPVRAHVDESNATDRTEDVATEENATSSDTTPTATGSTHTPKP